MLLLDSTTLCRILGVVPSVPPQVTLLTQRPQVARVVIANVVVKVRHRQNNAEAPVRKGWVRTDRLASLDERARNAEAAHAVGDTAELAAVAGSVFDLTNDGLPLRVVLPIVTRHGATHCYRLDGVHWCS